MPGVADMSGEHGGQLHRAAARYGIPVTDWLDLSTGISPWSWCTVVARDSLAALAR